MLRYLSLFSGIGAFEKALTNLGVQYEVINYCEIDKYASKSYSAIHGVPESKNLWDITKVNISNLPKDIDIISHGSPCQDFSLAGVQRGGDKGSGTRSSLMWNTVDIVKAVKPKIVLWENVKNLISKKHKHNFDAYIEIMDESGYNSYWKVLNAKDYGIPQNRERVFTVSIRKDIDHNIFEFPKPYSLEKRLKDFLEPYVDEKYYLSDKMVNYISATGTKNFKNPDCKINLDVARPLTTDPNKRAGTTNYISEDLPENYDLNNNKCNIENRADKVLNHLIETNQIKELPCCCDSTINDPQVREVSNCITARYNAGIQNQKQIGLCVVKSIPIKEATKKGYAEAHDGDGVYINRPHQKRGCVQKGMIQTLKTSPDVGVVVNAEIKHKLVGGSYKYLVKNKLGNDRAVVVNDNNIYNLFFTIFDLCRLIDTKEKDKYERSRELLQILWQEIGKKEIWQEIRRFISVQEKKILQSNLYENGIYENRKLQSRISSSPSNSEKHNGIITNREKMLNMWEEWKTRYTPQRWELSKQQFRQFNLFMQELSYETTQRETSMQDMWQTNERFRVLQQTLFEIQEIWRPIENKISNGLRIRKLSPLECWRLMGFSDEDFEKASKFNSNSQLYKQAGNSIVVNVLEEIFGMMLDEEDNLLV